MSTNRNENWVPALCARCNKWNCECTVTTVSSIDRQDHTHEEIMDSIEDHVSYLANTIIKLTARVVELEKECPICS